MKSICKILASTLMCVGAWFTLVSGTATAERPLVIEKLDTDRLIFVGEIEERERAERRELEERERDEIAARERREHAEREEREHHERMERDHNPLEQVEKLHRAAEALHEAGLHREADELHHRAEQMERAWHEHREQAEHHPPAEHIQHELMVNLKEIHHAIHALRQEVAQMREEMHHLRMQLQRPAHPQNPIPLRNRERPRSEPKPPLESKPEV